MRFASFTLLALGFVIITGCATTGEFGGRAEAPRVERGYLLSKYGREDVERLWAYYDPADATHYGNIFRMSNGRIIGITLSAKSTRGMYAGDELYVFDFTREPGFNELPLDGSQSTVSVYHIRYSVQFAPKGDDVLISIIDENGSSARVSLNALYRWRVQKATDPVQLGNRKFKVMGQSGEKGAKLFFTEKAASSFLDPDARRQDFFPAYTVYFVDRIKGEDVRIKGEIPIGDSGYVLVSETNVTLSVRLAK